MTKKLSQTRKAMREDLREAFPNWRKVSETTGVAYETIKAFVDENKIGVEDLHKLDAMNLKDGAK